MQTPTKTNLSNVNFFTHHAKLSASADFKWRFELLHNELISRFPPDQRDLLENYFDRFCELHNLQLNSLFQDYLQFVCFLVDSMDASDGCSEAAFTDPVSQETFSLPDEKAYVFDDDSSSASPPVGYTNTRRTPYWSQASATQRAPRTTYWSEPSATQRTRSFDSFLAANEASGKNEARDDRAREKSRLAKSFSFRFRNKSPKKEVRSPSAKATKASAKRDARSCVVNRNDAVLAPIATEEAPIVYPYTDRAFAEKLVAPTGNLNFNLSWTPEFSNWSSNSPLADANADVKDRL